VRVEDLPIIREFLEVNRSSYKKWKVIPNEDEAEKLRLHSA
jgi:hypothetical protein